MKWTGLNELREKYLSFFESKGHLRLQSFSLIPNNDKSLLLINSGMAPMKKYFTGEVTPPSKRVTTCQKCIRTPDLERVGHTARHGTYFEMLGNFSFGDYFKKEAIPWSWEFLTQVLEIPADRLWPSVYQDDDEAYALWRDVIGVPEEHIVRLGKEDNFWEHGTGPCGPCSEIYFDRGEKYGCGSPDCKPGCDCDRYMEIWNNVFSQFNNMGDGTYTELEHKYIDTGMGLERLACVMQGVDNMFEVDTIRSILNKVCAISGKTYGQGGDTDVSIRAITDHARAATFMISDGIIPSNEGRGYVLRRLIRRAARHGKLIGINRPFLTELCDAVIKENSGAYPELAEKQDMIKKVLANEEAGFDKTIDQGLAMLGELMSKGGVVSGEDAFRLYDTYGFPVDLTKDILAEKGMTLDEETFRRCMQQQREMARASRKAADAESWKSDGIAFDHVEKTAFAGYTEDVCTAQIVDIVCEGEHVAAAADGRSAVLVLDRTVFYGEGGGQAGDTGVITGPKGTFTVTDTQKTAGGVYTHIGTVQGGFTVGETVTAAIDTARRAEIRRNHTAAHLLQAGLRRVLGTHVEQAGQLVNEKTVRFDFTHFSALTKEETAAVEAFVNQSILDALPVVTREMPVDEAKKMGAMALFGEKYGKTVRVVSVEDRSMELCGGTHVDNTGKIGLFRILSESSVAAGVRRIEAVTGTNVLQYMDKQKQLILTAAEAARCNNPEELPERIADLTAACKAAKKELADRKAQEASGRAADLLREAKPVKAGVGLSVTVMDGADGDTLRTLCDSCRDRASGAVVVLLAGKQESTVSFACFCTADAVRKGAHAGNIVRAIAALCGGRGGGRPDYAMAGGKEPDKLGQATAEAERIVADMIKE